MFIDMLKSVMGKKVDPSHAPDLVAFKGAVERKDRAMDRLSDETDALKMFVSSVKGPKPYRATSKRAS